MRVFGRRGLPAAVEKWGCSSVWLECRSVTPEAAGSSPVSPVCFLRESGLADAGAVAQLGERLNGIQEVRGSTPLGSIHGIDVPKGSGGGIGRRAGFRILWGLTP